MTKKYPFFNGFFIFNVLKLINSRETFTVRKKSGTVGVSRIFPVNAPTIDKITVVKKGKVRRAKLNFIKGMRKEYKVKERN